MASPKSTDQTLTTGLHVPTAAPHGGGSKFPPFDASTFAPQLVWLVLSFVALYMLMSRVALPRIGSVIDERRERIARDLAEAERMKAETDAALKAYEQSLADARAKAQAVAKDTREKVAADLDRDRQKSDQANAAKVAEMEKRIGDSKARALASVNDIAVETAGALVGKLLGRDVPIDEIRKALATDSR